jgi:hypothetical protein
MVGLLDLTASSWPALGTGFAGPNARLFVPGIQRFFWIKGKDVDGRDLITVIPA